MSFAIFSHITAPVTPLLCRMYLKVPVSPQIGSFLSMLEAQLPRVVPTETCWMRGRGRGQTPGRVRN